MRREWRAADEVKVQTASGAVVLRQSKETATLLSRDAVQTIIPVGKLVQEGYSIRWDKKSCQLGACTARTGGRVPISMGQGCPVVSKEWGEKMLDEIEATEQQRIKVRSVMKCGVPCRVGLREAWRSLRRCFRRCR